VTTEDEVVEKTKEQQEQDRQQMEAGFAEADEGVGTKTTITKPAEATAPAAPEKSDAEREAQAKEQASNKAKEESDAAAKAESDAYNALPKVLRDKLQELEKLPGTVHKIASHIGGLTNATTRIESAMKAAKTVAEKGGGDSPTDKAVKAAFSNPEAFKQLKEDFPDWAGPIEAEFAALRAEISKQPKPQAVDVEGLRKEVAGNTMEAIDRGIEQAEERFFMRLKHPDWKTTINSQNFKTWMLDGGPSDESFRQYKELQETDPEKASKLVHGFASAHPQWWGERGAFIFSDSADDAVKLLDGYETGKKQDAGTEAARLKKVKRLEGAVVPQGTAQTGIRNPSEQEAMLEGFASVDK